MHGAIRVMFMVKVGVHIATIKFGNFAIAYLVQSWGVFGTFAQVAKCMQVILANTLMNNVIISQ